MKVVLSACVLVAAALAAPAPEPAQQEAPVLQILEKQPEVYRGKRSHFGGGVQYYSPCQSAPIAAIAPAPAYHAPAYSAHPYTSHGYAPHGYGYGPQYRDMEEQEMMAFSDMDPMMSEHMPMMSRLAYPAPAALPYGAALGGLPVPATTGPAFGVFPNANASPCSVPLLLTCSPSIVRGNLVNAHPSPSYVGQEAYRADEMESKETESQHHHHQHSHHDQQPSEELGQDNANAHQ